MKKILALLMLALTCTTAQAVDIDLNCSQLAQQVSEQLSNESLLTNARLNAKRAQVIVQDLCAGVQTSAQQQHEEDKRKALKEWIFQPVEETPGHKRLKRK